MGLQTPLALISWLDENQFLTPAQMEGLRRLSGSFGDVHNLVRELVKRDWLTPYQANQILQGHGDQLILGPYRLLERLGEGSMGQVFKARHVGLGRLVALKIIHQQNLASIKAIERFKREALAAANLAHPNIVAVYDANEVNSRHFLALELVEGIDLARMVKRSGPLPIAQACEYIRQASLGLQHAWDRGVVHRDIKPSNLLVTSGQAGVLPQVKILDFGLARYESAFTPSGRLTQLGSLLGTVDYIAPEQAENAQSVDVRADIFSLGCTLFYLLGGRPPFEGETVVEKVSARIAGQQPRIRALRPDVPVPLQEVLLKMMARDPVQRYQTPSEIAKALLPFLHQPPVAVPVQAPPVSATPPLAVPAAPVAHLPGPAATPAIPALSLPAVGGGQGNEARLAALPTPAAAAPPLELGQAVTGDSQEGSFPTPPLSPDPLMGPFPPQLASASTVEAVPSPFGVMEDAAPAGFTTEEPLPAATEGIRKPARPQPATNRWGLLAVGGSVAILAAALVLWVLLKNGGQGTYSSQDRYANPNATLRILPIPTDIVLKKNKLKQLRVQIERREFRGPVEIDFEQLPEGVSVIKTTIPDTKNYAEIRLSASQWAEAGRTPVRIVAKAKNLRSDTNAYLVVEAESNPGG